VRVLIFGQRGWWAPGFLRVFDSRVLLKTDIRYPKDTRVFLSQLLWVAARDPSRWTLLRESSGSSGSSFVSIRLGPLDPLNKVLRDGFLCWVFPNHEPGEREPPLKNNPRSILGVVLQGGSCSSGFFFFFFRFRRPNVITGLRFCFFGLATTQLACRVQQKRAQVEAR